MTEPRGARSARPGEGGDDEDDAPEAPEADDKLTAMRAVWLSMRDEEPSTGGLAELLAAARTKAVEMQPKASWWQRALAGLRRPPVFAFATALVLVAGAVVVERNVKHAEPTLDSAPSATVPAQTAAGSATSAPMPVAEPAAEPSLGGDGEKKELLEGVGRAPPSSVSLDPSPARRRSSSAPAPSRRAPSRPAADPGSEAPVVSGGVPSGATGRTAEPVDDRSAAPGTAPSETSATKDTDAARERQQQADAPPPPPAAAPTVRQDELRGEPTLYQQCTAAAERGDCVTVRRLVERIGATDRNYRARIAPGSAIAKCLATAP